MQKGAWHNAGMQVLGIETSCDETGIAIYDSDAGTVTHHRVAYDIAATRLRMRQCGLPESLARRLSYGR